MRHRICRNTSFEVQKEPSVAKVKDSPISIRFQDLMQFWIQDLEEKSNMIMIRSYGKNNPAIWKVWISIPQNKEDMDIIKYLQKLYKSA